MREFLHVDDMAEASVFVMNLDINKYRQHTQPMLSHINVGSGVDCSIRELVATVAEVIGYQGEILFDKSKPDGTMRKLMDSSCIAALGWTSKINLFHGLSMTYTWFIESQLND
jgi:GDP-L-fucose synthase